MNLWVIFLTGLTTGGLSCLAVQGGLLTSVIANQKEANMSKSSLFPITLFLTTKLIAHVMLGFFLGWLGSKLTLNVSVRLIFQGLAAFFMVGTALNLLEVHPIFRYMVFQPPRIIRKLVKNTSKGETFFTPAILGLLTVFIPCGVTQSMEVLAMSSVNPLIGAAILGVFVLGTSPIFALIGVATAKLSEKFQTKFLKIAAVALIVLAVSNINGILVVLNAPIAFRNRNQTSSNPVAIASKGVQEITIIAGGNGYAPNKFTVKVGVPVQLTVETKDTLSCSSSFIFKPFNISFQLGPNDSKTATFIPAKPGTYQFSCGMGMYHGVMEVI